jgi:tRNA (guanine-N7-)-methyltransferase
MKTGPGPISSENKPLQSGNVKSSPDRLYGRARGHKLRPRQQLLLDELLPRLRLTEAQAADPRGAFGSTVDRLWLEVGFGGGEHAAAQVAVHPDAGLIACEVFENGICSLLSRLAPDSVPDAAVPQTPLPPNLLVWDEDARALLRLLPPASLDRLFLLFPDPWPKSRHAKRRFVHPETVRLVAHVLRPGAEWRVASDDPTYQAWVAEVMGAQDLFAFAAPAVARPSDWPPTRYEAKALRAGRTPLYWSFRRNG